MTDTGFARLRPWKPPASPATLIALMLLVAAACQQDAQDFCQNATECNPGDFRSCMQVVGALADTAAHLGCAEEFEVVVDCWAENVVCSEGETLGFPTDCDQDEYGLCMNESHARLCVDADQDGDQRYLGVGPTGRRVCGTDCDDHDPSICDCQIEAELEVVPQSCEP